MPNASNIATRLLVTGDWHYRSTNPRARLDNIQEALHQKIYEVYGIAGQKKCNAIVVPGDITDSPNMSYSTFSELGRLLGYTPCPIYAVPGNHDIFGANPETKYRTPFGALVWLGFLGDLSDEPFESNLDKNPPTVAMTGSPYSASTDIDIASYLFGEGKISPELPHKVKIQVAHGMLLERAPGYELRHTLIKDVANHPNAPDVLIVGHDHIGFGVKRMGKTLFINPGALVRLTAHPAEIERTVQVCILTIYDDGSTDAELVPLESAKPGYKVLSREHLEAQAEREEKVAAFLALLAEEGEARFLEVREIVEDIARRESISRDVVDEALRRIGAARESIGEQR